MNQPLKFMVRNAKRTPLTRQQSTRAKFTLEQDQFQKTFSNFKYEEDQQSIDERICRLQGNLKVMEKKYKDNLKEGFDHKINAYRLEAVVERKMLKQAISDAQKLQQAQRIKQKLGKHERLRQMSQERSFIYQHQRREKEKFIKSRNESEKRRMSLTIYKHNEFIESENRRTHDKIVWEEQNSDKKKLYFEELRAKIQKKELTEQKKHLLTRMVSNTEKLKRLKQVLEEMQVESTPDITFLTL